MNAAMQTATVAESALDHRFALLSFALASRSQVMPPSFHVSNPTALSTYLPPSVSRPEPTTDPQELMRALSRVDAERPPAQVGDSVRRAVREVQRVNEVSAAGGVGVAERRLTGVPPPTPRKPPGTPRRGGTPGREK